MLTNSHDPSDTIETFQPVTVGIHVQEMKGFRKELIISLLSPNAFSEVWFDRISLWIGNRRRKVREEECKERKRQGHQACQEEKDSLVLVECLLKNRKE